MSMSIWQKKEWGKMLVFSKQVENIFYINGIQIEKRSIGMGQFGLFILGVEGKEINNTFLKEVRKISLEEKTLFFQIETINYFDKEEKILLRNIKENIGFYKKFITPYAAIIDLEKTEDEILGLMKPKGRYNIKKAIKNRIVVKSVEKVKENVELYYNLMLETTSRDNFNGNSLYYYIAFLEKIKDSELLLAYKDGVAIAGGIFLFSKDVSIYYYGASTSKKEYRNLMAPYLVQWEAIKLAKSKKSKIYDFLGVSSPNSLNDSLSGVTEFKKKFTLDIRNVSEGYIFINKPFFYYIFNIFRKIKKLIK